MAFTGNYMCTSFKKELMQGIHNLSLSGGNTFRDGALYRRCYLGCKHHRVYFV